MRKRDSRQLHIQSALKTCDNPTLSSVRTSQVENNLQSSDKSFWIAMAIVFLFLVLRRSAAYCGMPPLYGGEMTIVLFAAFFFRRDNLKAFYENPYGLASMIFALLPLPYIIVQYRSAGTDAIMYSSVAYYAAFLYFGYSAVSTAARQRLFTKVLYYAILLSNIHYLVSTVIPVEELPPLINGVSLLGHSDSCYIYFGVGIAYALIFSDELGLARTSILLGSSILGHLWLTERGSQLGILGVLLTLAIFHRIWLRYSKRLLSWLTLFGGLMVGTWFLIAPNSEFTKMTVLQLDLVISTFSRSPNAVRAGTKEHRLAMWKEVIEETLSEDPVLGQGVKGPLVDVAFRNPHNSFLSIFGRFGVVGLVLAVIIYFVMPVDNMIVLTHTRDPVLQRIMLLQLCFVPAFMGAALFGPTLVSPFSALVCNFIYGASLRCSDIVRRKSQAPAVMGCARTPTEETKFAGNPFRRHKPGLSQIGKMFLENLCD